MAPTDLAMPRRVATGVDPKRLAMLVAVLTRHARVALGQADVFVNVAGGVRIDEPGADLAVCLAIASAARGVPVRAGLAAFGEVGLTGRLRPAPQAERRLEECAKLGLDTVLVPAETPTASRDEVVDGPNGATRRSHPRSARSGLDRLVCSEQGLYDPSRRKCLERSAFSAFLARLKVLAGGLLARRRLGDYDDSEGRSGCTRSATRWCIHTTEQARSSRRRCARYSARSAST